MNPDSQQPEIILCPETNAEHELLLEGHCSFCVLCGWSACSL